MVNNPSHNLGEVLESDQEYFGAVQDELKNDFIQQGLQTYTLPGETKVQLYDKYGESPVNRATGDIGNGQFVRPTGNIENTVVIDKNNPNRVKNEVWVELHMGNRKDGSPDLKWMKAKNASTSLLPKYPAAPAPQPSQISAPVRPKNKINKKLKKEIQAAKAQIAQLKEESTAQKEKHEKANEKRDKELLIRNQRLAEANAQITSIQTELTASNARIQKLMDEIQKVEKENQVLRDQLNSNMNSEPVTSAAPAAAPTGAENTKSTPIKIKPTPADLRAFDEFKGEWIPDGDNIIVFASEAPDPRFDTPITATQFKGKITYHVEGEQFTSLQNAYAHAKYAAEAMEGFASSNARDNKEAFRAKRIGKEDIKFDGERTLKGIWHGDKNVLSKLDKDVQEFLEIYIDEPAKERDKTISVLNKRWLRMKKNQDPENTNNTNDETESESTATKIDARLTKYNNRIKGIIGVEDFNDSLKSLVKNNTELIPMMVALLAASDTIWGDASLDRKALSSIASKITTKDIKDIKVTANGIEVTDKFDRIVKFSNAAEFIESLAHHNNWERQTLKQLQADGQLTEAQVKKLNKMPGRWKKDGENFVIFAGDESNAFDTGINTVKDDKGAITYRVETTTGFTLDDAFRHAKFTASGIEAAHNWTPETSHKDAPFYEGIDIINKDLPDGRDTIRFRKNSNPLHPSILESIGDALKEFFGVDMLQKGTDTLNNRWKTYQDTNPDAASKDTETTGDKLEDLKADGLTDQQIKNLKEMGLAYTKQSDDKYTVFGGKNSDAFSDIKINKTAKGNFEAEGINYPDLFGALIGSRLVLALPLNTFKDTETTDSAPFAFDSTGGLIFKTGEKGIITFSQKTGIANNVEPSQQKTYLDILNKRWAKKPKTIVAPVKKEVDENKEVKPNLSAEEALKALVPDIISMKDAAKLKRMRGSFGIDGTDIIAMVGSKPDPLFDTKITITKGNDGKPLYHVEGIEYTSIKDAYIIARITTLLCQRYQNTETSNSDPFYKGHVLGVPLLRFDNGNFMKKDAIMGLKIGEEWSINKDGTFGIELKKNNNIPKIVNSRWKRMKDDLEKEKNNASNLKPNPDGTDTTNNKPGEVHPLVELMTSNEGQREWIMGLHDNKGNKNIDAFPKNKGDYKYLRTKSGDLINVKNVGKDKWQYEHGRGIYFPLGAVPKKDAMATNERGFHNGIELTDGKVIQEDYIRFTIKKRWKILPNDYLHLDVARTPPRAIIPPKGPGSSFPAYRKERGGITYLNKPTERDQIDLLLALGEKKLNWDEFQKAKNTKITIQDQLYASTMEQVPDSVKQITFNLSQFDIETGKAFEKIPSTVNRISFPNIHEFNEGTMQAFKYLPHIKRDLHFESAKLSEFPLELATHISETNVYLHPNTIISDEVKLILGDRIKPIPGVKPTKKLPQINTKKASQSTTTNTTINTMSMGNKNKKTDADKLQESITDPYRQEPKKSEESRSGYTPNPKISSLTPIDGEKENTNNISPDSSQSNY